MSQSKTLKSKRPEVLQGKTIALKLPCGNNARFYLTINSNEEYTEILTEMRKSQCYKIFLEAIARLTNLAIRKGATTHEVTDELYDLNCGKGDSCPHVIATNLSPGYVPDVKKK